jgi:hypothetical protein
MARNVAPKASRRKAGRCLTRTLDVRDPASSRPSSKSAVSDQLRRESSNLLTAW